MVGPDGELPLPWLAAALDSALRSTRAHAVLIHGPQGVGQFEMSLVMAQAWLCDDSRDSFEPRRPCGVCASCRLVQSGSHPDLLVLLPEVLREALGWAVEAPGEETGGDKASKAKPSKEIKVDAVRGVVAFAQTTSSRGSSKVVVMHPAERMNPIAANTLLKTLEEPPGGARFILSCASPDALLPTIRSRCQAIALVSPGADQALQWLKGQGVDGADVLLPAAGGRPIDALEHFQEGFRADAWLALPGDLARGNTSALGGLALPRLIATLQKVCHDTMALCVGGEPRFFPAASLGRSSSLRALSDWAQSLAMVSRQAEHPWNAGLMLESLALQARTALTAAAGVGNNATSASLHYRS